MGREYTNASLFVPALGPVDAAALPTGTRSDPGAMLLFDPDPPPLPPPPPPPPHDPGPAPPTLPVGDRSLPAPPPLVTRSAAGPTQPASPPCAFPSIEPSETSAELLSGVSGSTSPAAAEAGAGGGGSRPRILMGGAAAPPLVFVEAGRSRFALSGFIAPDPAAVATPSPAAPAATLDTRAGRPDERWWVP